MQQVSADVVRIYVAPTRGPITPFYIDYHKVSLEGQADFSPARDGEVEAIVRQITEQINRDKDRFRDLRPDLARENFRSLLGYLPRLTRVEGIVVAVPGTIQGGGGGTDVGEAIKQLEAKWQEREHQLKVQHDQEVARLKEALGRTGGAADQRLRVQLHALNGQLDDLRRSRDAEIIARTRAETEREEARVSEKNARDNASALQGQIATLSQRIVTLEQAASATQALEDSLAQANADLAAARQARDSLGRDLEGLRKQLAARVAATHTSNPMQSGRDML